MPESDLQYLGLLVVCNVPVFVGVGKLMFGSWTDFWECVTLWFQPDWMSAMFGELDKDAGAFFKLLGFIAICILILGAEHLALVELGFVGGQTVRQVGAPGESGN